LPVEQVVVATTILHLSVSEETASLNARLEATIPAGLPAGAAAGDTTGPRRSPIVNHPAEAE
jgi:hypothetical protein